MGNRRLLPLYLFSAGVLAAQTTGATLGAIVKPGGTPSDVVPFFGDPAMKHSEVIVDWSGLAPKLIGVYQLSLRVPGFHTKGDPLPVTIRIGGVSSPADAPVSPKTAVD